MMVRVSPMTAASFAETRARSRLGMAMAAMIPMMATTIRSSMRVNPFSRITLPPCHRSLVEWTQNGGARGAPPGTDRGLLEGRAGRAHGGSRAAVDRGVVGRPDDATIVGAKGAYARLVGDGRLGTVAEYVDGTRADAGGRRRCCRELARVALLHVRDRRDGGVQERRGAVGVANDAARGEGQTRDGAVEARVRRLIRGLAGNHRPGVTDRTRLVGGHARAEEAGDGDRGDDPDDRHDNQQLDKGEPLLILQFVLLVCDIARVSK